MSYAIPEEMEKKIGELGIIAVLIVDDPDSAAPLAQTLLDNGIGAMELTLRTEGAMEALTRIRREVPAMLAGVGTILRPEQVGPVRQAGAAFGVAPGFNPAVAKEALKEGLPFGPGISTPSELEGALGLGSRVLKYFHAEQLGGVDSLKGINAPYSFLNLKYIPLGGLHEGNIRPYLERPEILALGGSWIAPRTLIQQKDWSRIGRNAAEAVRILRDVRGTL